MREIHVFMVDNNNLVSNQSVSFAPEDRVEIQARTLDKSVFESRISDVDDRKILIRIPQGLALCYGDMLELSVDKGEFQGVFLSPVMGVWRNWFAVIYPSQILWLENHACLS